MLFLITLLPFLALTLAIVRGGLVVVEVVLGILDGDEPKDKNLGDNEQQHLYAFSHPVIFYF